MARTKHQRNQEDVWMIQVRDKGNTRQFWSVTSPEWFSSRSAARKYIRSLRGNFDIYDYRARRYSPCTD